MTNFPLVLIQIINNPNNFINHNTPIMTQGLDLHLLAKIIVKGVLIGVKAVHI